MTTASEIINAGFREANFSGITSTPSVEESAEGLTLLRNLVNTLFQNVANIKPVPWYVPRPQSNSTKYANYPARPGDAGLGPTHDVNHPPANSRLMMKNTASTTIYFQYQPQDGALMEFVDVGFANTATITLDANGALFGLTGFTEQVAITKPDPTTRVAPRRWVYRADWGSWLEISTLAAGDELPFPSPFDDYFITAMAIRLSPRFGASPRPETLERHRDMETMIRQQYFQMKEQVFEPPWSSHQSYTPYGWRGDPDKGIV